jgi:hypothetical protein
MYELFGGSTASADTTLGGVGNRSDVTQPTSLQQETGIVLKLLPG